MTIEKMRERQERNAMLGTRSALNILQDLSDSTWGEQNPQALIELRKYKQDIAGTVEKTLNRARCL